VYLENKLVKVADRLYGRWHAQSWNDTSQWL